VQAESGETGNFFTLAVLPLWRNYNMQMREDYLTLVIYLLHKSVSWAGSDCLDRAFLVALNVYKSAGVTYKVLFLKALL
jgi:hypothetical protein